MSDAWLLEPQHKLGHRGLLALLVALLATNFGQALLGLSGAWWDDIVNIVRGLLGMAPSAPTT